MQGAVDLFRGVQRPSVTSLGKGGWEGLQVGRRGRDRGDEFRQRRLGSGV